MKKGEKSSIRQQLHLLAALQCILVAAFWIYMMISETVSLSSDIASEAYQSGEKALTQIENDLSALARTTLFPSYLSIFSNDDSLCAALRKGSIEGDRDFGFSGFSFYSRAQSQLTNSAIDFIAVYDLYGNGVYLSQNDISFSSCTIRKDAAWYDLALSAPLGSFFICGSNEFNHSGIPGKDSNSLCIVRTIADPRQYKNIGICVAGIKISDISNALAFSSLYPGQEYAVYLNQQLVYSDMGAPSLPDYRKKKVQSIQWKSKDPGFYHTVFHGKGNAIVIKTPFSLLISQLIHVRLAVMALLILTLILFTITIFTILRNILNPLRYVISACNEVEANCIPTLPDIGLPNELGEVFSSFNHMSEKINTLINEVLIKDLEKQETELQLLRTQINPHYLYNTLEIMHMTAYKNRDYDMADMAELLGKNLQYGLRETTKEVTLKEELDALDIYLSILSYQFKDKISFNKVIDPQLLQCKTIKLIFQPMVENSVFHGFSSSEQKMIIDILGYRKEDSIILCVSDNGIGMFPSELEKVKSELKNPKSQTIGIRNISRRIRLFYGEEYGLSIDSVAEMGTTVIVSLPYHLA